MLTVSPNFLKNLDVIARYRFGCMALPPQFFTISGWMMKGAKAPFSTPVVDFAVKNHVLSK